MSLSLPTFPAGGKIRASQLTQLVTALGILAPIFVVKPTDENWNSGSGGGGTTLHNDSALFASVAANTSYWVDLALEAIEAAGTSIDIKAGWTFPTGARIDFAAAAPHLNWSSGAGTALEVEWSSWQGETTSPSTTKQWGTVNGVAFSYHVRGVLRVGANSGTLQFQWAQNAASASNLTVKAGSTLKLQQLP
jgi:hypothetical protein